MGKKEALDWRMSPTASGVAPLCIFMCTYSDIILEVFGEEVLIRNNPLPSKRLLTGNMTDHMHHCDELPNV